MSPPPPNLIRPQPAIAPGGSHGRGVTAVLGPTNTGKTHLAIERMLGHENGIIGLPLRLLAREVYGRIVERVGANAVALITGEEKIKPKSPKYWVSTVESMPRDIVTNFVAVDEIQLIADPDRGHIFTDAALNRRGSHETMLLGAATAKPLLEGLLPGITVQTRPRLSTLTYAGEKKITRLPARSAIIAFSAEEVYAIAELVRRQHGGAAVVMGSLSPRTRNAQVAMFQAGEVDHIVATDAIGMGLNLEITHVAFASDRKFDGNRHRRLYPNEIAQIAGRAGRAQQDGTFGTTGRCPPFDDDLIETLENNVFEPLTHAQWRNSALDFQSIESLEASLNRAPGLNGLMRARRNEDEMVLDLASSRPGIRDLVRKSSDVRKLWDICQLPDYRKVSTQTHGDLALHLFEAIQRKGTIDAHFFAREIASCDRVDGDIDALSWRLAQVRTWAYCANRDDWLDHPVHWQNVTRALEDRLSDALHEKLMQRFVDRRTSVLMRRLKENVMLDAQVTATGDVIVEAQHIGRLEGFRFTPDATGDSAEAKALRAAAAAALGQELETRATRLSTASDEQLTLSLDGVIRYIGEPIASLRQGAKMLEPGLVLLADEMLGGIHREMAETRLNLWLKAHIAKLLGPLFPLESGEALTGIARGIAFRIAEAVGVLDRAAVSNDVRALDQNQRGELRKVGVRFGAHHLFLPAIMKPGPRSLAAQLFALQRGQDSDALREVSHLAFSGRTSIPHKPEIDAELYRIAGFKVAGPRAIRVDILERLADLIRPAIAYRPGVTVGEPPAGTADGDAFIITGGMTSLVGCAGAEFSEILRALGYRSETRKGAAITAAILKAAPMVPIAAPVAAVSEDAIVETISGEESAGELHAETDNTTAAAPLSEAIVDTPVVEETTPERTLAPENILQPDVDPAPADEASDTTTEAPVIAELPEIELWRVARAERPRHQPNRGPRQHTRPQQAAGGEGASEGAPNQNRGPRRDRGARQDSQTKPEGQTRPEGQSRTDRNERFAKFGRPDGAKPSGPRPEGSRQEGGRSEGGRPPHGGQRFDRGGKPGGKPNMQPRVFSSSPSPKDKALDPDSPFAKLAALKAQLEQKN